MTSHRYVRRLISALVIGLVLSASLVGAADARRGGGFGSRGSRTYSMPSATYSSPYGAAPIQRSMTPQTPGTSGTFQPGATYGAPYQPAFAPRFGAGGGFLGGLLTGGLLGGLLGHGGGWGGGGYGYGGGSGGLLGLLFPLVILGLGAWLVMRLFRRRGAMPMEPDGFAQPYSSGPFGGTAFGFQPGGGQLYPAPNPGGGNLDQIGIGSADRAAFEQLLIDVQSAFGREDYAALRTLTTPEVMSFLAEEMSDNATHGRRNDVSAVRLLRQDLSEAWREPDADYATAAMHYESVELMRDRQSGAVIQGSPDAPSETTEVWTFMRRLSGPEAGRWKLSAIQDV